PLPTTRSGGSALGPAKSTGLLAWARWARFIARATRSSVAIDVPPELSSAFGYGPILGWPHSLTNCLLHRLRVPCRGARSLRPRQAVLLKKPFLQPLGFSSQPDFEAQANAHLMCFMDVRPVSRLESCRKGSICD